MKDGQSSRAHRKAGVTGLDNRQIRQTTRKPSNLNHRIISSLEPGTAIIQRQERATAKAKGRRPVSPKAAAGQHRTDARLGEATHGSQLRQIRRTDSGGAINDVGTNL